MYVYQRFHDLCLNIILLMLPLRTLQPGLDWLTYNTPQPLCTIPPVIDKQISKNWLSSQEIIFKKILIPLLSSVKIDRDKGWVLDFFCFFSNNCFHFLHEYTVCAVQFATRHFPCFLHEFLVKLDFQWQFWNLLIMRIPKHPLHV